ncbi:Plasmodium vivax Vir protein, putative [Plasmodium vivax]|uniref:Vir protein, putative n=1 Tax=Plasmodium vivax TaxID=5855 RepID=A0A1G4E4H4_PLAVI|nr:Plasmodium vivax Vir protein, putative [Plasmodium vivax]
MTCKQNKKEESYEFFENIVNYIDKAKSAESNAELSNAVSECNSFMKTSGSYFTVEETAKRICQQYVKLYNSLTDCKINSSNPNYQKCRDFLNYWVNFKLRKSMKYEDYSVPDVYNLLESQITGTGVFGTDLVCIHNINMNDLNKMNILYSLYEKYSKLNDIIKNKFEQHKQSLSTLSTACCLDYIKASYLCNDDNMNNNPIFCKKLDTFKLKHDALHTEVVSKDSEYSDQFIKLSECHNNKIITTAVTGTVVGLIPLLGVLYKFTPMVQVLRSKMGILNNDISKNDEEMIKMSLMDQENEQIPFQKKTYNIKYQSL